MEDELRDLKKVNKFTLAFKKPRLEKEFMKFYISKNFGYSCTCLIVGILIYISFGLLDYAISPTEESFRSLVAIRYGFALPISLIILTLLLSRKVDKYLHLLLSIGMVASGLSIILMHIYGPSRVISNLYYPGIMMCLIYGYMFKIRFTCAVISGSIVTFSYVYVLHQYCSWILTLPTMFNSLFFVIATNVIGLTFCFVLEKQARRNFIMSKLLSHKKYRLEMLVKTRTKELEYSNTKLKGKIYLNEKLHKEKQALERDLNQSKKLESIGTLTSGITHDFNNIIMVIIGHAELAEEKCYVDSENCEHIQEILMACNRARHLVKQIIQFGSSGGRRNFYPTRMCPIINEVIKLINVNVAENIKIETDINCEDVIIMSDQTKLHQIFMNLCSNAIYAMRYSGGVLKISLNQIKLTKDDVKDVNKYPINLLPGEYAYSEISDTGCGIPKDKIDRIFDPYFTTKTKTEGTGLGLSVVHGIVTAHHGKIIVSSEENIGTTFQIYLPLK